MSVEYKATVNKENENETIIEKSGQVYSFTVGECRENLATLAKQRTEVASQQEVANAKIENIKHFNPFIADLTEEQQHAVYMYYQAFVLKRDTTSKLAEIDQTVNAIKAELVEIEKQCGVTV
jgi:hypothetical protein